MVISAKPTRMARHSAGGGRLAKREFEDDVREAIVAAWEWSCKYEMDLCDTYHCRSKEGREMVFVYMQRDVDLGCYGSTSLIAMR